MKLNPKKCSFSIEECPFLGHLITKQGIRANPSKVKAITDVEQPKTLKDIQSLNEKIAALSRFISKSAERSLPFFKVLKRCTDKKNIQWTQEAKADLQEMKKFVEILPMLTALIQGEGAKLNYPGLEKLILALVHTARRLRRYFQAHTKRGDETPKDFLIEVPPEDNRKETEGRPDTKSKKTELSHEWKLYTDGAASSDGTYAAKQLTIREYLQKTKEALKGFDSYTIEHIRRNQNKKADALSKLASMTFEHLTKEVLVEVLSKRSIEEKEILQVETKEGESWMTPIHEYLVSDLLPEDPKESRKIRVKAPQYKLIRGSLYRRSFYTTWLRYVASPQTDDIVKEIHEGSCGFKAEP
ncbi:reverse transcriptase domain-containing protein [Tanacetum coccineum]